MVAGMTVFSMAEASSPANGHKVKITGSILVHEGDTVQILNVNDGSVYGFKVTDKTTIRCDKGFPHGKTVMDASALVPAVTVEVEGIRTPQDMPEARTIKVNPDTFALTAAHDKQSQASCGEAAQDAVPHHGIGTLFNSFLP